MTEYIKAPRGTVVYDGQTFLRMVDDAIVVGESTSDFTVVTDNIFCRGQDMIDPELFHFVEYLTEHGMKIDNVNPIDVLKEYLAW